MKFEKLVNKLMKEESEDVVYSGSQNPDEDLAANAMGIEDYLIDLKSAVESMQLAIKHLHAGDMPKTFKVRLEDAEVALLGIKDKASSDPRLNKRK